MVWELQGEADLLKTRWPRVWEAEREVQSSSRARVALVYKFGSALQGCTRVSFQHHRNTSLVDQGSDAHCLENHADGTRREGVRCRRPERVEVLRSAPVRV